MRGQGNFDSKRQRYDRGNNNKKSLFFLDSPFLVKYTDQQLACSILDWPSVEYSVMYKNKEQW